ncbi:yeats family-domain-containing protein [Gorgonomyces haynaldii]|nr:yeats family-domain-containing protein [Gorgonomyces haynaldii]
MSVKRMKNFQTSIPFVYGSHAFLVDNKEELPDPTHTHRWRVFVGGVDGQDLSCYIRKVVFKLHESFASPVRTIEKPPYVVEETGWGQFEIVVKIYFHDPVEKNVSLSFQLMLFPDTPYDHQNPPKQVINERYDEFIFQDPTETMYNLLIKHPYESLEAPNPSKLYKKEQEEIKELERLYEKALADYEKHKKKLDLMEDEVYKAQQEL